MCLTFANVDILLLQLHAEGKDEVFNKGRLLPSYKSEGKTILKYFNDDKEFCKKRKRH